MNEEKVKKYSKDGMICCGIITIISIVGFIFITIFDRNISDIAVFGGLFVLLIITCVFGFVKFYKQFNNPNNKKVNNNAKTYRGYLYNSEWNWDIAEANYRIQYNKKDTDLNEKDEEIIWKYCCTEIAFYLAWLVENEFLTLDPVINETIEKVKKRQTMPDDLFECIDLKLSEEDVSDKILPFIDYCLMMDLKVLIIFIIKCRKNMRMFLQTSMVKEIVEDAALHLNGMIMMNLRNF